MLTHDWEENQKSERLSGKDGLFFVFVISECRRDRRPGFSPDKQFLMLGIVFIPQGQGPIPKVLIVFPKGRDMIPCVRKASTCKVFGGLAT